MRNIVPVAPSLERRAIRGIRRRRRRGRRRRRSRRERRSRSRRAAHLIVDHQHPRRNRIVPRDADEHRLGRAAVEKRMRAARSPAEQIVPGTPRSLLHENTVLIRGRRTVRPVQEPVTDALNARGSRKRAGRGIVVRRIVCAGHAKRPRPCVRPVVSRSGRGTPIRRRNRRRRGGRRGGSRRRGGPGRDRKRRQETYAQK